MLKPGAILRIGVPDFRRYVEGYLAGGGLPDAKYPWTPTRLMAVNEQIYGFKHRWMWDAESLELLCREAGFSGFSVSSHGASSLGPIERPERAGETLYVEAVR